MATVEFIDLRGEIKEDARGISFFPWQGRLREPGEVLRTFHLASINPGQTRGNPLHPGFTEWLYVFPHRVVGRACDTRRARGGGRKRGGGAPGPYPPPPPPPPGMLEAPAAAWATGA